MQWAKFWCVHVRLATVKMTRRGISDIAITQTEEECKQHRNFHLLSLDLFHRKVIDFHLLSGFIS